MDFKLKIVTETKNYPDGINKLWKKAVKMGVAHRKIAYGVLMDKIYYICIPADDPRDIGKEILELKSLSKLDVAKKTSWESEGTEIEPILAKLDLSKIAILVEEYTESPYTIVWVKYK